MIRLIQQKMQQQTAKQQLILQSVNYRRRKIGQQTSGKQELYEAIVNMYC